VIVWHDKSKEPSQKMARQRAVNILTQYLIIYEEWRPDYMPIRQKSEKQLQKTQK